MHARSSARGRLRRRRRLIALVSVLLALAVAEPLYRLAVLVFVSDADEAGVFFGYRHYVDGATLEAHVARLSTADADVLRELRRSAATPAALRYCE